MVRRRWRRKEKHEKKEKDKAGNEKILAKYWNESEEKKRRKEIT